MESDAGFWCSTSTSKSLSDVSVCTEPLERYKMFRQRGFQDKKGRVRSTGELSSTGPVLLTFFEGRAPNTNATTRLTADFYSLVFKHQQALSIVTHFRHCLHPVHQKPDPFFGKSISLVLGQKRLGQEDSQALQLHQGLLVSAWVC